jgi:glycerol-3-phosphate dehydrogenase
MAIAAPGPSGQVLTAVPWADVTLVGTWQSDDTMDPATPSDVPGPVLDAMLKEVNATFPSLQVRVQDVRLIHHGLTPAVVRNGRADLMPASLLLGPGTGTRPGLFAVIGVKFTTARQTAEAAIDRIGQDLGRSIGPSRTATTPLPHARLPDVATDAERGQPPVDLASGTHAHLLDWYGTEAADVAAFSAAHGLLDPLDAGTPVIAGEIAYAATHAQARRLSDAVLRRTRLGSTGHPGDAALARAAAAMGRILDWTQERQAEEISAVLTRYATRPRTP